jgi:hypothetical protein
MVGYFAELLSTNEEVNESIRPLLKLSRDTISGSQKLDYSAARSVVGGGLLRSRSCFWKYRRRGDVVARIFAAAPGSRKGLVAWLFHGLLWATFHLFPQTKAWDMIRMIPTCCALAFVAQYRKSSWPGIFAHTVGNSGISIGIIHGITH